MAVIGGDFGMEGADDNDVIKILEFLNRHDLDVDSYDDGIWFVGETNGQ